MTASSRRNRLGVPLRSLRCLHRTPTPKLLHRLSGYRSRRQDLDIGRRAPGRLATACGASDVPSLADGRLGATGMAVERGAGAGRTSPRLQQHGGPIGEPMLAYAAGQGTAVDLEPTRKVAPGIAWIDHSMR